MGRRPLYGWLTANAVSLSGTRLSMLALPWFVLTTTGSPTRTGLVALVEMAPLVILQVLGGPVIDRLGPRRVAIACDLASTVVVALIPLLYAAGALPFGTLLLLVAAGGALRGPGDAAKHSLTPQIAAATRVPTERVTGLASMIERSAGMLGAACAGILIGTIGAPRAIAVDAASFAVSAGVLGWATAGLPRPEGAAPASPYLRRLREGWDFLRGDRILVGILAMVTLTNLIDQAYSSVLMPVWGRDYHSAEVVGLCFALFAGASAAGSALAAHLAARLPRYATYLVAFVVCGLPRFVVTAWDVPLVAVGAVLLAGGFASGFINPILGAVQLERIPAQLLGRVSSLSLACSAALIPFGGLPGGGLVGGLGLTGAMLVCGAAYFVVTMFPAVDRTWRGIDTRPTLGPGVSAETSAPVG